MDAPDLTELINTNQDKLSADQQHDIEAVYNQLKQIARVQRFKISNHGLNTTSLVNEAWLKTHAGNRTFNDRRHFFAYCALAMRHILLDQARRNKLLTYVDDESALDGQPVYRQSDFLLDLERQLLRLGKYSKRLEQIFTLKFYGEMTFDDISDYLKISRRTAIRDWKKAQAMLSVALGAQES